MAQADPGRQVVVESVFTWFIELPTEAKYLGFGIIGFALGWKIKS
jgi:hypothetical protein